MKPSFMHAVIFLAIIFWFAKHEAAGQVNGDITHLKTVNFEEPVFSYGREVTFGIQKKNGFLRKYNPVNLMFSSLMFTYQRWISPQISADCLFHPTCSSYSQELFQDYGFFRGLVFSSDRFMRCDRISATTVHPISINPEDGKIHETPVMYQLKHGEEHAY
ncbi:MAG: membrane protein insertion efficiency factor YidD [Bacteroidota bacterium]